MAGVTPGHFFCLSKGDSPATPAGCAASLDMHPSVINNWLTIHHPDSPGTTFMDKLFITNVLLSFVIAGSWIAFSSLVAERLGIKIGGLIANLPANLMISLLFVTFVRDVDYVADAVLIVPSGLVVVTVFLLVFIMTIRSGLLLASVASLAAWFGIAYLLSLLEPVGLLASIGVYLGFVALVMIALDRVLVVDGVKVIRKEYSKRQVVWRAVFSGGIVASVVVVAKFSPPHFTGILATFPAMLFSTLFILARNQGSEFVRSVGKVLTLTTTNLLVYALAVYFTYPVFGVLLGTLLSYLASVAWVILLYPIVRRLS